MAPLLIAGAIGSWNAVAGLQSLSGSGSGRVTFALTLVATVVVAGLLAQGIRQRSSRRVPGCLLVVAATYTAPVVGDRAGPLSAGLMGLALLALALTCYTELALARGLPTQTVTWSWRTSAGVVVATALLDAAVAVVSGGGTARPGHPSTLSVAVACAVVTALVAGVTALADGVVLPERWTPGRRSL